MNVIFVINRFQFEIKVCSTIYQVVISVLQLIRNNGIATLDLHFMITQLFRSVMNYSDKTI